MNVIVIETTRDQENIVAQTNSQVMPETQASEYLRDAMDRYRNDQNPLEVGLLIEWTILRCDGVRCHQSMIVPPIPNWDSIEC